MEKVQVIILAAGKGTRMESDGPKALTLLRDKPFISHVLDTVSEVNLNIDPIIVIGHQKEKVTNLLGSSLRFSEQTEQLGTGHAVMSAHNHAHENEHKTVLVLYADHPLVSPITIKLLIEKQQETGAKVVMAPTKVPSFDGWYSTFLKWGRFKRGKNGEIEAVIEYKDATEDEKLITEVNPGYLAFDAEWMWNHLKTLKNENSQGEYYLTDLVKIAFSENEKIEAVEIPPEEAIGANSKEELTVLEKILENKKTL